MEINFRANLINNTSVMKRGVLSNRYLPSEASFVKLDLRSTEDIKTLKKLRKLWSKSFLSQIYHDATMHPNKFNIYALTTQMDKFEKLNPKNILGLAEATEDYNSATIEYLQTHPKYAYEESNTNRAFVGIGTSLLNTLKGIERFKDIKLISIFSAIDFYAKNGFDVTNDLQETLLVWKRD